MVNDLNGVGAFVVSWDFTRGGKDDILLIGEKGDGRPAKVINVLLGDDAHAARDVLLRKAEYHG